MRTNSAVQSRLSRKLEKKSKKIILSATLGILIVLFLVFKFAIPFLTFLAGGSTSSSSTNTTSNQIYVAPPAINPMNSATNSAQVIITGIASSHQNVEIYVNDQKTDVKDTKDDGTFSFANIALNQGSNTIKVRAKQNNKYSDFSDVLTITYKNQPVTLSIDNPHDGDSFSKDQNNVIVSGKTDPDIKGVTVNDFWAIVDDKGNYSYNLHLNNGDNQLKVVATDTAGNKTEKDMKVTYSQ